MGVLLLMAEITTNMVIIGNSVFTLGLCAATSWFWSNPGSTEFAERTDGMIS